MKNVLSDQLDDQNLRSHYSSYTPQPPSIKTSHYHTTQVKTRLRLTNFRGALPYSVLKIGSSKSMDWRNSRKSTPFKPSPFHGKQQIFFFDHSQDKMAELNTDPLYRAPCHSVTSWPSRKSVK